MDLIQAAANFSFLGAFTLLNCQGMVYGIVFERVEAEEKPSDLYHAHIPTLGLTTHGEGVEGARAAAVESVRLWLAEKRAAGESVRPSSECFFSTMEIPDDALQAA